MWQRVEQMLSLLLVAAALVIAVSVARREFLNTSEGRPPGRQEVLQLVFEPEWRSAFDVGITSGDTAAPVQLVQFADLECPACRDLELRTLSELREPYGDRLAITYVHFPLPYHRFARAAAQAAECAHLQGQFQPFIAAVYTQQDSLGLKRWSAYASEAGVSDTVSFNKCLSAEVPSPRIDEGFSLGEMLRVRGTPTVLVNGWRFGSPPNLADLSRTIDDLLLGRRPSLAGPSREGLD